MRRDFLRPPSDVERGARYPVRVLVCPDVEVHGIGHGPPASRERLPWAEIRQVVVAEVGEPEGVRTVVFDLVTRGPAGLAVMRLDADPGDAAMTLARGLETGLGPARTPAALKSLAADGLATSWFPDLRSFEEGALGELESGD